LEYTSKVFPNDPHIQAAINGQNMRLIGMLDSPYVRRVAISLDMLSIPFRHEAVSVFSTFARFQTINPVVKAPTLVCENGDVLMDSSLILQFLESTSGRSLWSPASATRQQQFRAVSLAMAACEKSVQIVYEKNLRPPAAQYQPWLERVSGQLLAAYAGLEHEVQSQDSLFTAAHSHASVTAAVVWRFTRSMLADIVPANDYPGLAALSTRMELLPAFIKYPPVGPGIAPPHLHKSGRFDG
jgi:glutathione S-transferase